MIVQLNTDHNIVGDVDLQAYVNELIDKKFARYSDRLSRIEVNLKDTNGDKSGTNDKHCTIEARLNGKNPTAVTHEAASVHLALKGAVDKLKANLEHLLHD